jgi:GST-like protein
MRGRHQRVRVRHHPYTPPAVWTWNKASGGRFASINRPVAGATHDKELPVGRHPLQLYSLATPNGVKVTVMLEELLALGHAGAEYDAWLVRINEGEQFGSGFVAANPNSKIPALVDHSGPQPVRVFESGAILLYLAEKFGAFLPTEPAPRAPNACRGCSGRWAARPSWAAASATSTPTRPRRSNTRSTATRWRSSASSTCWTAAWPKASYLAGDDYTIADMAVWPWYGALAKGQLYEAGEFLQVQDLRHVLRWTDAIAQRPAAQRGRMVNRTWGEP